MTLDHLIALNDEIAALVRAGVPLERGLADAGSEVGGRLGALERAVAERAGRGEPLGEALRGASVGLPELYRAIVEAGVRSGHLARALEGLATHARGVSEARRDIGQALLYPVMVLALAYTLFVGFVVAVIPRFRDAFTMLGLPRFVAIDGLARLGETAQWWGAIVPLLLVGLVGAWVVSGWSRALDAGLVGRLVGWFPGVRSMLAQIRNGNFADLLALLVEHDVPLTEAIPLAADASGDRRFRQSAGHLADTLARGGVEPVPAEADSAGLPPLLVWLLRAETPRARLAPALRHAGATYRRRALWRAGVLRSVLPVLALLLIGAGAVLAYGLLLFVPLTTMLHDLGTPVNR